jgi:Arabidopsis proteins of unknown function.
MKRKHIQAFLRTPFLLLVHGFKNLPSALSGVLAVFILFGSCGKGPTPKSQKEAVFTDFIASVSTAKFEDYSKRQNARVESADEFEKMRKHILSLYEGVTPVNTFLGTDNEFVDCVPIDQQPGLRNSKTGPQKLQREAPKVSEREVQQGPGGADSGRAPKERQIADLTLKQGTRDRFGKEMYCQLETIPMRRLTLEQMTRFRTLKDFFSKGGHPFGRGQGTHDGPRLDLPGDPDHYYAAGFQTVNNFGGDSWLNLWSPNVSSHRMSLSQIWVSGGDGAGKQTVEAGWQVYPDKWGGNNAALFIFYTPNNYDDGCYNLDCSGFVQVANNIYLGSGFDHYSSRDGGQWGFNIQVKRHTDGNWWLFYRGAGNYIAFGYYPHSLYGDGILARNATRIGWGGEDSGEPTALQMGSGALPNEGWGRAAYHDVVFYIDTNTVSQWPSLSAVEIPSSNCYDTDISNASANRSKTYLYYGGPRCN